jgi:cobalt-precorrin 5A hydrolase/precorrin-3B C17-methyltransferase
VTELLRSERPAATPVVLGRDVGRADESVAVTTLHDLDPTVVDMRTVVIVGSSTTRTFVDGDGRRWVYTPRDYPA